MPEPFPPALASATPEAAIVAALGKRSVVLVGMMGAGKSTIGRRMAARLRLPFVDADNEIEAAAGMSIPDIFEVHGEPHFRDGEARVIARLLDGGTNLLATGGGAILRDDTRQSTLRGLYPTGEGAGYAGGIMSAAIDGILAAEAVLNAANLH